MPPPGTRRPRTDAVRNSVRLTDAAADLLAEHGPDVSLEDIAQRAGVGIATLYRHFPNKDELVRTVIEQAFAREVVPALDAALADGTDAGAAIVEVWEAALGLSHRHRNALAAAKRQGHIPMTLATTFFVGLAQVLARAQEQGSIRADLVPEDLPRLTVMLINTPWLDDDKESWRRYLALVMDGLRPVAATPLPVPAPPVRMAGPWRTSDPTATCASRPPTSRQPLRRSTGADSAAPPTGRPGSR